jgi:hypothetical protein
MYGPPPFCKRNVKVAGWSAQMYSAFVGEVPSIRNDELLSVFWHKSDASAPNAFSPHARKPLVAERPSFRSK